MLKHSDKTEDITYIYYPSPFSCGHLTMDLTRPVPSGPLPFPAEACVPPCPSIFFLPEYLPQRTWTSSLALKHILLTTVMISGEIQIYFPDEL